MRSLDFNVQYHKTRVTAGSVYFWGQNNNFTILGVKIPQNSPNLARMGFAAKSAKS